MIRRFLWLYLEVMLLILIFFPVTGQGEETQQIRVAVFNFGTANLEASGYGTMATNMLMTFLKEDPSLELLDRKELEAFLNLNDLQQDENLDNVVNVGSRLGLNVIIVGNVGKKGSIIAINSKVIHIDHKKIIYGKQIKSFGDAGLMGEIRELSRFIATAISGYALKSLEDEKTTFQGPVNLYKRSGSSRVSLCWENPSGIPTAGYEVFRGNSAAGPFAMMGQVSKPEYLDPSVARNSIYYYKIRAFNSKGLRSEFSAVIAAETAPTPNPPVILRAEGHIKGIQLTWSPSPISSDDPLKMKGYKLYRAKVEQGPFREVANILGKDLGIGVDSATTLDKLFKVSYADRNLADGEEYYYRVTAYNEKSLESEMSCPIKGKTVPMVSTCVARGDMVREISISCEAVDSPFVKGYYVYRSTSEGSDFAKIKKIDLSLLGSGKIQHIDTEGLADNMRYYYRVTAFEDPDSETSPSFNVSAITKGKPPTPSGFSAKSGLVGKVELSWSENVKTDIEGYNLYCSDRKDGEYLLLKKLEGRNINRYVDDTRGFGKLDDNQSLFYRLTSFNKVNVESSPTSIVSATTKKRPSKPQAFKGESRKVREVPLAWAANPESDIDAYLLYRSATMQEIDFVKIARVKTGTTYVDKDLKDGVQYYYRLQAEDKDGLISDQSNVATVQTKSKPAGPTEINGDYVKGIAELRWKPSLSPDVVEYIVYERRLFGVNNKLCSLKDNSFKDETLSLGKSRSYVVTAVDGDGLESDPSQGITITGR